MWKGVVSGLVGVIAYLAIAILFPASAAFSAVIATSVVSLSVSLVVFVIFSRWAEERADKIGFSICSNEAKQAGIDLFCLIRISIIDHRNSEEGSFLSKMWRKCAYSQNGEYRLGILHPFLENRIKYLQALLPQPAC